MRGLGEVETGDWESKKLTPVHVSWQYISTAKTLTGVELENDSVLKQTQCERLVNWESGTNA
jgi:hypothetical protein